MSDLIDFLEHMGRDSQSRFATGPELEEALLRAGIEPSVRSAVLAGDQPRLEALVGANRIVCNMVNIPEVPPSEEEEEEEEGDDEEEGDADGAEKK